MVTFAVRSESAGAPILGCSSQPLPVTLVSNYKDGALPQQCTSRPHKFRFNV